MTSSYLITGMTCAGCLSKVNALMQSVPGVSQIRIDLPTGLATIEVEKYIPLTDFKKVLEKYPKYQISETGGLAPKENDHPEIGKMGISAYKPIFILLIYIVVITTIGSRTVNGFDSMKAMRIFMAAFFIAFSFFKMLDLQGFAGSYSGYDILAKRFKYWGFIYPFAELSLGISFAINFQPHVTNLITAIVMTISLIGVLQSILNKRKIQCACLGTVFKLPMSTVTIVEDGLMIVMALLTLVLI